MNLNSNNKKKTRFKKQKWLNSPRYPHYKINKINKKITIKINFLILTPSISLAKKTFRKITIKVIMHI